jgi:hypothetical protein
LKHYIVRQKLEKVLKIIIKVRKLYLYKNKYNHVIKRPRNPNKRFLIVDKITKIRTTKEDGYKKGDKSKKIQKKGILNGTKRSNKKRKANASTSKSSKIKRINICISNTYISFRINICDCFFILFYYFLLKIKV